MTNRERAMNILHYKPADRMPAVHFGYWEELLAEWADQKKIPKELAEHNYDGSEKDRELDKLIGWDFNWSTQVGMQKGLYPEFEFKVLEELPDGSQRVQNSVGLIERIKPGIASIPSEDDYQLKDREAFETLYKPKMQYMPERIDFEFYKHFNETRLQDRPVGLSIGSVLGDIRNMTSVVGMSYLIYDEDEELFADIVDTYAEMQYKCVEAVLETGAKFDYAHFWEDICFKNGPLVIPDVFRELAGPHYRRISQLAADHGIDIISLDCDGKIDTLVPVWVENGVNTMFPIEVGTWDASIAPWREKYGRTVRGVGGMNKTVFAQDYAAVDREIERLKPLMALGGYIPCPDHRIPPDAIFENVQYYCDKLQSLRL